MDKATTLQIIGIAAAIVAPFIYRKRQKQQGDEEQKLRTHFEGIKSKVIDRISEMARSLIIRNERLVYGSYTPVNTSYDFEKEELYKCFELHFPEEVKEWKKLNKQAVKLNEKLVDFFQRHQHTSAENRQSVAERYMPKLQLEFKDFNKKLVDKAEDIEKYGIGKAFKKIKNCPICKKF